MKKGVSPIVAVLLLIIIAVAAAVVTYGFVMGFIGRTTTTTAATQAMIVVDAVNYTTVDTNKGNVTVYVRNVGPIPVNVTAIYVYDAVNVTLVGGGVVGYERQLAPGSVGVAWVEFSPKLPAGRTYYVKVVTAEGAAATSEVFRVD